jgi:hypothetical protein
MEIKDRTWTIQACSAVTKEGNNYLVNGFIRTSRGYGMASEDHIREEMSIKLIFA